MINKNNLYKYRVSKNHGLFSQKDLADKLNVSRQTIINLESGKFYPSLELAFKIAKYFNCKIEDIWDI